MNCPACKSIKGCVVDSRTRGRQGRFGDRVRRRRRCLVCGYRWSTLELTIEAVEQLGARPRPIDVERLAATISAALEASPA